MITNTRNLLQKIQLVVNSVYFYYSLELPPCSWWYS